MSHSADPLQADERPIPRPIVQPGQAGRSVTHAPHGMVATSHPLAAQVGLAVLQRGGNAIDAAIAVNAMLGVVEPMSCGIGGDLFAIVWDAKTGTLHGLNASGAAPQLATMQAFRDRKLSEIPTLGPLSWSVPGCVDGWFALHSKFGKLPMRDILGPSAEYAETGFPVSEVIAGYWKSAEGKLRKDEGSSQIFLIPDNSPAIDSVTPPQRSPRTGERFRNPALAATYRAIAKDGRDAFYRGAIADELDAYSQQQGGLLRKADLVANAPTWIDPVSTTYRGVQIAELPPPGQGIAVLQMLNLLEPHDLRKLGPKSPEFWHLMLEAKKLAYADRARYYADPRFAQVPTAELISKDYAARQAKRIDPKRAAENLPPGDPKLGKADTVYLCVVDKDRNCVSLIQSLYNGFGSGKTPAKLGFPLQNRGTLFALDPNHPNRLEPGKRPFHTIIPAMALRNGKPWLVFGVMGGDMQPQGHVQVLVNLLDFQMNLQQAGEAPRMEHVGSASPTGEPESPPGGTVKIEPGISDALMRALQAKGHRIERVPVNGGGFQAILIDPDTGMLQGASEHRKDGAAIGY
ncbi:gamma-glutamyltransferase [Tuwongella immobilis]|uniref:Glutathione hydrolase proenzyme n=1 Tax=Tuwongella immobilis TaxID=692036 RepID=A0A6C2YRA9_9BACT|nr:gamma-glutamyltransferase [Tuwongella immobilis]VIP04188.1 gamma-glutamyltransferase : Gamma-glutamyltranspeptidase OS=Singulisphaera acidiphila (strain ATCC BAA-1392 / DSM 18658 / VKM B-2454 / MOB10) GN=Sinac_2586 PE=4 SV=1: G_glu_transpept [Tuwongella immobilis]VTS05740.1 gamma-glutamyltransferase : Gamma-glutamyltranspeptidase OS=Singulisphaera acidiphila (strain ATCC BAA-1392 / DSM 18658 / VKM B-2454 / MOB10) GN=Sinac_2586 PE=4 SV=1: G_glu_transpept [Tuwongella immobilis]